MSDEVRHDDAWDAGAMGCGELVLELFFRMKSLPSGAVLKLTAADPGAPEDIPAWCRMVGFPLVEQRHPDYWIRKEG